MTTTVYRYQAPYRRFRWLARLGVGMSGSVTKYVNERFPVELDLRKAVPSGTVLTAATVSAVDLSDSSTATSTVLTSSSGRVSGTLVATTVRAGTAGHRYRIEFQVRDSVNSLFIEYLTLVVR